MSPMTAEIAQKGSCPIDKVPLCNQPCLLSDLALWGRTGDLQIEVFWEGEREGHNLLLSICTILLLFLSPYHYLFSILNMFIDGLNLDEFYYHFYYFFFIILF